MVSCLRIDINYHSMNYLKQFLLIGPHGSRHVGHQLLELGKPSPIGMLLPNCPLHVVVFSSEEASLEGRILN